MKQLIKPIIITVSMMLLAIVAGSTIALAISSRVGDKKVSMTTFEVSKVEADVASSDGNKHRVSMNFYFELSDDLAATVSVRETRKQLVKIISELDYDKLTDGDSVGYVRENVVERFSENIDHGQIGNVYITDMVTGKLKFYSDEPEEEEPEKVLNIRNQQRFNALFNVTD